MFDDAQFEALQERFADVGEQYSELIEQKRSESVENIIVKGNLYDVFPYEIEQRGDKRKGKTLTEIIPHNECHIYHFDAEQRLILIENVSPFAFDRFPIAYYTLYSYNSGYTEKIYGAIDKPYRVEWGYYSQGLMQETLCWAKQSCNKEEYLYNGELLQAIHHTQRQHKDGAENSFDLQFVYNDKKELTSIFRKWPSGRTEITYSTQKINYKKLEDTIYNKCFDAVSAFLNENKGKTFTRFAMDSYTGDISSYACLAFDQSGDAKYADSPADWTDFDFASFDLINFPLDDQQIEKLQEVLAKVAVRLVAANAFSPHQNNPAFKVLLFDHNAPLTEISAKAKKILKEQIYHI